LSNSVKERTGYLKLKEEAIDRSLRRSRFGRGYGPGIRQSKEWMNVRRSTQWSLCFDFEDKIHLSFVLHLLHILLSHLTWCYYLNSERFKSSVIWRCVADQVASEILKDGSAVISGSSSSRINPQNWQTSSNWLRLQNMRLPSTLSFLNPNIPISTLFSNILLEFCQSHAIGHKVSWMWSQIIWWKRYPDGECSKLLWNVGTPLPYYTMGISKDTHN
jgi:hypothetical protein